ncbi:MAG: ABC transporter permease [Planctomycetota bacterium]
MTKTLVIAIRDYLAAVKTKSFLISLAFMPVLVIGGMLIGRLSRNVVDTSEKRIAVIDRAAFDQARAATRPSLLQGAVNLQAALTNDERADAAAAVANDNRPLSQILIEAAQQRDEEIRGDDGKPNAAPYAIEVISIESDNPEQLAKLRLDLSDRVRDDGLFAFIEIGPNVTATDAEEFAKAAAAAGAAMEELDVDMSNPIALATADLPPELHQFQDLYGIRYSSKSTTNFEVSGWINSTLAPHVQFRKLEGLDIPFDRFQDVMQPLAVNQRPLAKVGDDGAISYESQPNQLVGLLVPVMSVFLLFGLIATAAFPLTTNIIEEKQMRIAEVLLGSVRPFELMLGKLLGGVAISLTLAAIYGAGGLIVATQFGMLSQIGPDLLIWFGIFGGLATLMVGAMSVAVGAAVTNLKEAQNLQTPVVLLPMLPAMVAFNVAQNPQGPLAQAFTWFPLTTPITSVMRIGVRDGMATTDRFLAVALSIATTLVLVWLAGRIFRHGMLRSEKAAGFGEMMRWVTRG